MNKKSKRIVLIHGWADRPTHGWMAWLAKQTECIGYTFVAPQMPSSTIPDLQQWINVASSSIGSLSDQPILIGHSLGTNILLRYLAQYSGLVEQQAKALILVSGFVQPGRKDAEKFFPPILDLENVSKRCKKIYSIYSDDDKLVLPSKSIELAEKLGGELICLHSFGHFLNKRTPQIPELLSVIKSIN